MDNYQYQAQKKQYLDRQKPYKVIEKRDISYVGDNLYNLDGREFLVPSMVADSLDKFIGLKREDVRAVASASGEDGVRDYRNYMAMVNSISKPEKMAIIADPGKRKIISAVPLKKDVIPMESLFDFAEMFANDNNYEVSAVTAASDPTSGIELRFIPDTKNIVSLGPDEDFMTNGFTARWNLGEIEIGHYYERLICSNGATEEVYSKKGTINAIDDKSLRRLLGLPASDVGEKDFGSFSNNAYDAMETNASLAELNNARKLLLSNGVQGELVESVIPYQQNIDAYSAAGYDPKHLDAHRAVSNQLAWDIFNRLTWFATHNDIWSQDDNRRSILMAASAAFLRRPRDIRQYVNIF